MFLDDLLSSLRINGDRNAFCIKDEFYKYSELEKGIKSIISQLEDIPDDIPKGRIGIVCSDDFETYASLLAVWFSGSAYVPLGLQNPVERNLSILTAAGVSVIISKIQLDPQSYSNFTIIQPNTSREIDAELDPTAIAKDDLLYILFTSGSTGNPKGVPISNKNLNAFVNAFTHSPFVVEKFDRCLQMFDLTFDVSISSYLIPILKGACVYTVPNEVIKYVHVLKLIGQYELTSIQIVPSVIKLAQPLLPRLNLPSVTKCILTGEATLVEFIPSWQKCLPNAAIFNFYGPTEATIYCSYLKYNKAHPKNYNNMLAIGKALEGIYFMIENEDRARARINQKGELLIGGDQIASGYLEENENNSEKFILRILNGEEILFYRSGDLCFVDEEGDLFYCGRLDNQVKIQGFRVELSEIEVRVRKKFDINNTVIVRNSKGDAVELILVLEVKNYVDCDEIMDYLKTQLPAYMLPAKIMTIDEFPLNSSGKTDKNRIKNLI